VSVLTEEDGVLSHANYG